MLHSYQQSVRVLFSPNPCYLLSLVSLTIAILRGVRGFLFKVLICASLMITDIQHLFNYLLAIGTSFFGENVYSSFLPIFNCTISLCTIQLYEFCVFFILIFHQIYSF